MSTKTKAAIILEWIDDRHFKIIHQDESKIARSNFDWVSNNGVRLRSSGYPQWDYDHIFLRGHQNERDDIIVGTSGGSPINRQKVETAVLELNILLHNDMITSRGKYK
jgi:hypothetical protein